MARHEIPRTFRISIFAPLVVMVLTLAIMINLLVRPATVEASSPQKWALAVGVDRYDSDQISPLRYAAADAKLLASALVEVGGFPRSHVIVMTSDGQAADRPTAENILDRLAGFQSSCKPGDEFVFFFSGHGMEQDGESYLLTSNARLGSNASLKKSCLAVKEVQAAVREVKATRILQLVDACRNDPRSGRSASDNRLTTGFTRDLVLTKGGSGAAEAAITLFSCKVGQRSYEGYQGHGYFTWFLVSGLRGGAAGTDGTVTLPELVTYLESQVSDTVRLYESGKEQTPWADVSGTGAMNWVLSRPGRGGMQPSPTGVAHKPSPAASPVAVTMAHPSSDTPLTVSEMARKLQEETGVAFVIPQTWKGRVRGNELEFIFTNAFLAMRAGDTMENVLSRLKKMGGDSFKITWEPRLQKNAAGLQWTTALGTLTMNQSVALQWHVRVLDGGKKPLLVLVLDRVNDPSIDADMKTFYRSVKKYHSEE